jgi:hypothetical protein
MSIAGLDRASTADDWQDSSLTRRDWADREAKGIADDADAMNREYRTITTEQANDLTRAMSAISALLGRIEQ